MDHKGTNFVSFLNPNKRYVFRHGGQFQKAFQDLKFTILITPNEIDPHIEIDDLTKTLEPFAQQSHSWKTTLA
ncbi:33773_t:CDS:1, partial [Racocetra persica]